jgi:S1-C subfamily serine protease
VKKVVNDIIQYGNVQRGYLGVQYPTQELSEEQMKQLGIKEKSRCICFSRIT